MNFSGFLRSAQQIAKSVDSGPLPGHDGIAAFAYGAPDAPSEATYQVGRARYFIYAKGGQALQWAHWMHCLSANKW